MVLLATSVLSGRLNHEGWDRWGMRLAEKGHKGMQISAKKIEEEILLGRPGRKWEDSVRIVF